MNVCLVDIGKLKQWEYRTETKRHNYSVTLNSKTRLLDARFAIANTLMQLRGLQLKFTFTVYGGNGQKLYEYKS